MGQKTNPIALRLGIVREEDSSWFATNEYSNNLYDDYVIRNFINAELDRAGIANVHISRKSGMAEINVTVARPGVIFGKSGTDLKLIIDQLSKKLKYKVNINIVEERNPDLSARLLAQWICGQIERRIPFRRAMKMAVQRSQKAGAEGIRVCCAGRLGGIEIARTEWYREGRVPLHTFRANIDYAFTEALTTYGKIGVKVWINLGEVYKTEEKEDNSNKEFSELIKETKKNIAVKG